MNGRRIVLLVLGVFIALQLVPYGRSHRNPPVTGAPAWDSPRTEALARRACFDCHSHETRWPWYASIAPVSWRVQHDVDEGRHELNFSIANTPQKEARKSANEVREGEMPMGIYLLGHPEARLSDGEKQELIRGLVATFGDSHEGEEAGEERER